MNLSNGDISRVDSGQAQRLGYLISLLAKCCQDSIHWKSKRFGLLPAELRCLLQFSEQRYLTAKDLGQALELAKSRISKIVDGMIEKGLLERWTDPKDGRYRLLGLTDRGTARLGEVEAYLQNAHAMILAGFRPDERFELLNNLELLAAAMDRVKQVLSRSEDGSHHEPLSSGEPPKAVKGANNGKR